MADGVLPVLEARGLLFIGDAHVAATPPGHRREGYREQIMAKLAAALEAAAEGRLVPVLLGDLFHWPRENPNSLLVELIELFRPHKPVVLVGNHDKYQARFTDDVSLAVLHAAGAVRLAAEPGPVLRLSTPQGSVILGASPDGTPIPSEFSKSDGETVVWITHHNLSFPDFPEKQVRLREIPGVDLVVNGHIHRPQPPIRVGGTLWVNPGNMTRLTYARRTLERVPSAWGWRPGVEDMERVVLPHLPFGQVFPDDQPPELDTAKPGETEESRFLLGLERLALRRTREAEGLKEFLQANLNPERPETRLIWNLYEEVRGGHAPEHTEE